MQKLWIGSVGRNGRHPDLHLLFSGDEEGLPQPTAHPFFTGVVLTIGDSIIAVNIDLSSSIQPFFKTRSSTSSDQSFVYIIIHHTAESYRFGSSHTSMIIIGLLASSKWYSLSFSIDLACRGVVYGKFAISILRTCIWLDLNRRVYQNCTNFSAEIWPSKQMWKGSFNLSIQLHMINTTPLNAEFAIVQFGNSRFCI